MKVLCTVWWLTAFSALVALATTPEGEDDEFIVDLAEVRVEAQMIDLRELQLFQSKAMTEFLEELQLRDAATRAAELRKMNQNSITTVLDLTRYVPIPLGGSDPRTDTFFLQNYMQPDLNPPETDPLALGDRR
ncbi:hypothetical protein BH20VER1_BH20VER1_10130 [soil metagenome]